MDNNIVPIGIIANLTAKHFGIREKDLFTRTRKRDIKDRRFIFFGLSRRFTRESLSAIGAYCVKHKIKPYDHATVLHASVQTDNLIFSDEQFRRDYNLIKKDINDPIYQRGCKRMRSLRRKAIEKLDQIGTPEELEAVIRKIA